MRYRGRGGIALVLVAGWPHARCKQLTANRAAQRDARATLAAALHSRAGVVYSEPMLTDASAGNANAWFNEPSRTPRMLAAV